MPICGSVERHKAQVRLGGVTRDPYVGGCGDTGPRYGKVK